MKGNNYPFNSGGANSLSYKVAHNPQHQIGQFPAGGKPDNVSIPVGQITKITRQAKDKDQFK